MEPNDRVAGAPGTIVMGGVTYLVGQCSHSDIVATRKRLRSKLPAPMAALAQLMSDPTWAMIAPEVQKEMQREAASAALKKKAVFTEEQVFDLLDQHPDVVAFLAWILIRKHHPNTPYETIAPHVTDENASEVLIELYSQSGLMDLEKNSLGRTG